MDEKITPATLGSYAIRAAEHMHSRTCLAKAIIAAVENWRDIDAFRGEGAEFESSLDHQFRTAMQDNEGLRSADYYLTEGITECVCPPCPHSCCSN